MIQVILILVGISMYWESSPDRAIDLAARTAPAEPAPSVAEAAEPEPEPAPEPVEEAEAAPEPEPDPVETAVAEAVKPADPFAATTLTAKPEEASPAPEVALNPNDPFAAVRAEIAAEMAGGGTVTAAAAPAEPQLVAEPQTPTGKFTTATEVKPILGATRGNWVGVREFNGQDLVYVTHIWSWRCGLLQLKIGINGAPPEIWPLPECHMEMPMPAVMLEEDGLPYRAFELGSVQSLQVELVYDDLSTDSASFDRAQVRIP